MMRTHTCGELRAADVGREAVLCGWVWKARDLGGVLFFDLRDRYGFTQVVAAPSSEDDEVYRVAATLRGEDVVRVGGMVRARPAASRRSDAPTGDVELVARKIEVLNRAQTPPFNLAEAEFKAAEDARLEYRYLDLRRPRMQYLLALRHRVVKAIRDYLSELGFLEIETPILMKSTPEGARDYLVPSRLHRGKFYALPQSPQMYKQLLMMAGCDRYFQIARCFRDEDQRADRQPEFTQLDLEMSFATEEDVFAVTEGVFAAAFRAGVGVDIPAPWPRLTWREAMSRYGRDKPDIRFGLELVDVTDAFERGGVFSAWGSSYREPAALALRVEGGISNKVIKDIETLVIREHKMPGLAVFKVGHDGSLTGPVVKFFASAEGLRSLQGETGARAGDVILAAAGEFPKVAAAMGTVRLALADALHLEKKAGFHFVWVTDFPLFEADEETGAPVPAHHIFTAPKEGDVDKIEDAPFDVLARHYDVVLNGVELGSGSVRIHDPRLQRRIFNFLRYSEAEIESRFGFFLRAMEYGTPPHAGIAPGIDRWVMMMAGEDTIREVIAFPKTLKAASLLDGAPAAVSARQLEDLGLALKEE